MSAPELARMNAQVLRIMLALIEAGRVAKEQKQ
jgi:hypothetical protein